MAKDLRGGLKGNNQPKSKDGGGVKGQEGGHAQAEEIVNKYGNKSEAELMGELFKSVDRGKADGTLDEQELEKFADSVSGMLSPEQYQKMRSIIDTIKKRH